MNKKCIYDNDIGQMGIFIHVPFDVVNIGICKSYYNLFKVASFPLHCNQVCQAFDEDGQSGDSAASGGKRLRAYNNII